MRHLSPLALLPLAMAVTHPAMAAEPGDVAANQKTATQVFWRYAKCVAHHDPRAVNDLLASIYWDSKQVETATKLAVRNNGCALQAGDRLTMQPALFRSALATAMFVAHHQDQSLPNYAGTPTRFGQTAVDGASTPEQRQRALLLTLAECVFRNRPSEVRQLLEAEPLSDEEDRYWPTLNPVLNACFPAMEGTQLRFSRMTLRGLLGEAAYELDQLLPLAGAAKPETVH